jgi:hypothetical protein
MAGQRQEFHHSHAAEEVAEQRDLADQSHPQTILQMQKETEEEARATTGSCGVEEAV